MDYMMEMGRDRILSRQVRTDEQNRGGAYGICVHGIFDSPQVAGTVAEVLAATRDLRLEQAADMGYHAYREQQCDRPAGSLREHLGMDVMYRIMGISPKEKGEKKPDDGYAVGTGIIGRYWETQF